MAAHDDAEEIVTLNETELENVTNTTGRDAATVEGLVVAYTLMFTMALLPIFIGSIRSVSYHLNLKVCRMTINLVSYNM